MPEQDKREAREVNPLTFFKDGEHNKDRHGILDMRPQALPPDDVPAGEVPAPRTGRPLPE